MARLEPTFPCLSLDRSQLNNGQVSQKALMLAFEDQHSHPSAVILLGAWVLHDSGQSPFRTIHVSGPKASNPDQAQRIRADQQDFCPSGQQVRMHVLLLLG